MAETENQRPRHNLQQSHQRHSCKVRSTSSPVAESNLCICQTTTVSALPATAEATAAHLCHHSSTAMLVADAETLQQRAERRSGQDALQAFQAAVVSCVHPLQPPAAAWVAPAATFALQA